LKVGVVKFSEIMKDPHLRLDPSLYLREKVETERPIHRILSAEGKEKPDCVDVCERITEKVLEAGFERRELGLDDDELDHVRILNSLEEVAVVKKEGDFTKTERGERILFCLLEDDAQDMAREILGRELALEELRIVRKGIESGLGDWSTSLETAIEDLKGDNEE